MLMREVLITSLILILFSATTVARTANEARIPTPSELLMLPAYCKDSQIIGHPHRTPPDPVSQHWFDVLGENFWDIHHYCFGLNDVNRSRLARNTAKQRGLLEESLKEFDYVIHAAKNGFILLPEILTQKGHALAMLEREGEAIAEYQKAIQLKPEYWLPYAYLSDSYQKIGKIDKAREALTAGLDKIPNSKPLRRRLSNLEK